MLQCRTYCAAMGLLSWILMAISCRQANTVSCTISPRRAYQRHDLPQRRRDKEHPISMNLMAVSNDEELDLLAANLRTTFRRLSDSWGERKDNLLRFALHTLVQARGSTFFDLKRLLQDTEYRKSVVGRLTERSTVNFWQNDFAAYRDSIQPIISRIGKFMLSPLHGMLSQTKSKLNFYDLIQQKKILLVNLGGIGEDDAQLLGSLLVSQLQLAVMQERSYRFNIVILTISMSTSFRILPVGHLQKY